MDGVDLFNEVPRVKQGDEFTIAGNLDIDESKITAGFPMNLVIIGYRPAGSEESEWSRGDPTREWVGPGKETIEIKKRADLPPGDYDLRVYLLIHVVGEDMPTVDYLGSGGITIES